jgi:putative ABC transport system permease protein
VPLIPRALRYAARSLRHTPAFTGAAVLTLALGIGATTAIFSVVDGVLLRPLPYADSQRLVGVWFHFAGVGVDQAGTSDATYLLYRDENHVFSAIGAYDEDAVNLTGGLEPERVTAADVTASLFPTLGITALRGRLISDADDRPKQAKVVVISEGMWRRKFGGEATAVGRTIQINGVSHEIIGVLPAGFRYPSPETELWLPLAINAAKPEVAGFNHTTVARLKPGVSAATAASELQRILPRLAERYPDVLPGMTTREMLAKIQASLLVHPMRDDVVGDVGRVLWVILGTMAFVLLVACANVANLFLVRADARQRELAVRAALGAGRGEVVRQFLSEGLVLAGAGGIIGIGLALVGLRALLRLGAGDIPRINEIGMDVPTLAVITVVILVVAILCSGLPILRFARRDLSPLLREGGRSATLGRERQRARQLLVVSQIGLALVLLTASGLMARTFWELRSVRPGFDPSHVLTFRTSLPGATYSTQNSIGRFYEQGVDRLAALPRVVAVGAVTKVPLTTSGDNHSPVFIENQPQREGEAPPVLSLESATSNYFRAIGIPLVAGRTFGRWDGERPLGETVVSARFAEHYFGDKTGQRALGRRLRRVPTGQWYTIVGVVGDVRTDGLDKPAPEIAYFPIVGFDGVWESAQQTMSFVIRTVGEPRGLSAVAQRAIHALDASLPTYRVSTMDEVARRSMARTSFTMILLGTAAGLAVVLGVIGIYGVVAYTVSLRTREIGVRIALGARPADVSRLVARQGLVLALGGVAVGLIGAALLTRFLQALLYGVSPTDPLTLGGAAGVLLVSAVGASWLPARRAATVHPMDALRAE